MTKIMLVEDDKGLREIYSIRLTAEGYDVALASDGEEALATAVREQPTLILSDVMMPKISGFDMLDILRSTPETKDVKVIMMTALSSEDQRIRGENLGADKYLVKSQVGIEDVVNAVHEVLGDSAATAATPTSPNITTTEPAPTPTEPAVEPALTEQVTAPAVESAPTEQVTAPVAEPVAVPTEPTPVASMDANSMPAAPSREPLEKAEAPQFDTSSVAPQATDSSNADKMEALLNNSSAPTSWPGAKSA